MQLRFQANRRQGAVMVEYALLIASVALTAILSVAVLGHKTFHVYGIAADIMPGASTDDNQPIRHVQVIPLDTSGGPIQLSADRLVKQGGLDRFGDVFDTPNAGDQLIVDLDK